MFKFGLFLSALLFAAVKVALPGDHPVDSAELSEAQLISSADAAVLQDMLSDSSLSNVDQADFMVLRRQLAIKGLINHAHASDDYNQQIDSLLVKQTQTELHKQLRIRAEQEYKVRSGFMLRASHILFASTREAQTANDQLISIDRTVEDLAWEVRDRVKRAELSFSGAASRYSVDPAMKSSQPDGADLGYFSVFELPYPLETAAYMTPVGIISHPVRTRFGVHLILVQERLPITGEKQVSQIMLRGNSVAIHERIKKLHQLTASVDFASVALQYSEDHKSRANGGKLESNRLINELEQERLRLSVGSISKPVRSQFGWHILKVTGITPLPSFESGNVEPRIDFQMTDRLQELQDALARKDSSYPIIRDMMNFYEENHHACEYLMHSLPIANCPTTLTGMVKLLAKYKVAISQLTKTGDWPNVRHEQEMQLNSSD